MYIHIYTYMTRLINTWHDSFITVYTWHDSYLWGGLWASVTWLMRMTRPTSERDMADFYGLWLSHTWLDSVWHVHESSASHGTLVLINDRQARGEHSTADEWVQRARGVKHKGQEREEEGAGFQHTMTSGFYFYFCRTSGWVVGGERIKEAEK